MTESLASKYKVPAQLRPLLEAFARETLRAQPEDLIDFGRSFFETLHQAQKANPRADVIGEEKHYQRFRADLTQRLTERAARQASPPPPLDLSSHHPPGGADFSGAAAASLPPSSTRSSNAAVGAYATTTERASPPPLGAGVEPPLSAVGSIGAAASPKESVAAASGGRAAPLPPLQLQSQRAGPDSADRQASAKPPISGASRFQQSPAASQRASANRASGGAMQHQAGSSAGNSRPTSPEALAATKIQAVYRGHFVRKHPDKFGIDSLDFTRRRSNNQLIDHKKDLKRHSVGGYTLEAAKNSPDDRAATRIQAQIRGYLTRKHAEAMKQKNMEAATKIQSHIRGYLTRKKLIEDGVIGSSRSSLHSNDGSIQ